MSNRRGPYASLSGDSEPSYICRTDGETASSSHDEILETIEIAVTESPVKSIFWFEIYSIPRITFLQTWDQAVVFVLYICTYVCYSTWIILPGPFLYNKVSYSSVILSMSVLITKLLTSVVAYLLFDGTLKELYTTLSVNRAALVNYIIPAFCYAITDSLTAYCYKTLDPATVVLLYHIRVVFILLLFQYYMRVSLTIWHWVSMILVVISSTLKECDSVIANTDTYSSSRVGPVIIVIVMAQITAFAGVYNEKLLKEQSLSLNVQNMALYFLGIVATLLFSIVVPLLRDNGTVAEDILNPVMWRTVLTYPVVVIVFLCALYGLLTSYFIKSLNNIVRELATALHLVGTTLISALFLGYPLGYIDFLATTGIIVALIIYNRNPIK